ncbi:MAG: hypothetical protein H5U36_08230 [Candidatus Caldatribacterium sp.]|nr:hypothetical protein [Candidatus Caldatribacterium sp.]
MKRVGVIIGLLMVFLLVLVLAEGQEGQRVTLNVWLMKQAEVELIKAQEEAP